MEQFNSRKKQSFFDLINKILLKIEIPKQMATLIMIINTVQNFPFLFDLLGSSGALKSEFSKVVIESIKMLRPIDFISKLNLGGLIVWILMALNIFLMIYLSYSFLLFFKYHQLRTNTKNSSAEINRMLDSKVVRVFYTTLVFFNLCLVNPVSEILMQPFFCSDNTLYERFDISVEGRGDQCHSAFRYILVILSCINFCLMLIISTVCCLFFVKSSYDAKDFLARDSSSMEWIMLIKKLSLIVITMPIKFKKFRFLSLVFQFFIQSIEAHHFMTDHIFYMHSIHKIFGVAIITELLFVSLILLGKMLNRLLGIQMSIYIILILFALFAKLSLRTVEWVDERNLRTKDRYLSRSKLERKFKMVYYLLKSTWSENTNLLVTPHEKIYFLINQYISEHFFNCNDDKCPCQVVKEARRIYDTVLKKYVDFSIEDVNGPASFLMNMTYIRKLLSYLIMKAENERFKKSNPLKIFRANFLFYEDKMNAMASIQAQKLMKRNLDIRQWFCVYRLLDSMKLGFDNMNRNFTRDPEISNVNLTKILAIEKNYSQMEALIIDYMDKYSKFIFALSEKTIFCKELMMTYLEFYEIRQNIDNLFFRSKNYDNPCSIKLYLSFVYFNDSNYKMKKNLKKKLRLSLERLNIITKKDKRNLSMAQLYNENTALFQVDASLECHGKILSVNRGAEFLTGHTIEKLESSYKELVLPNSLVNCHYKYIEKYLEEGYTKNLYKDITGFIQHKDGYIIPIDIVVKPMVNLMRKNFYFNTLFNKKNEMFKYIITDRKGIIRDIGQLASRSLKVTPKELLAAKIPIYVICPALLDYFVSISPDFESPTKTFKSAGVKLNAVSAFAKPPKSIREMDRNEGDERIKGRSDTLKFMRSFLSIREDGISDDRYMEPLEKLQKNLDGDFAVEFRLDSIKNMTDFSSGYNFDKLVYSQKEVEEFKRNGMKTSKKWKKFFNVGFRVEVNEDVHHTMIIFRIRMITRTIELSSAQTRIEKILSNFLKEPKGFTIKRQGLKKGPTILNSETDHNNQGLGILGSISEEKEKRLNNPKPKSVEVQSFRKGKKVKKSHFSKNNNSMSIEELKKMKSKDKKDKKIEQKFDAMNTDLNDSEVQQDTNIIQSTLENMRKAENKNKQSIISKKKHKKHMSFGNIPEDSKSSSDLGMVEKSLKSKQYDIKLEEIKEEQEEPLIDKSVKSELSSSQESSIISEFAMEPENISKAEKMKKILNINLFSKEVIKRIIQRKMARKNKTVIVKTSHTLNERNKKNSPQTQIEIGRQNFEVVRNSSRRYTHNPKFESHNQFSNKKAGIEEKIMRYLDKLEKEILRMRSEFTGANSRRSRTVMSIQNLSKKDDKTNSTNFLKVEKDSVKSMEMDIIENFHQRIDEILQQLKTPNELRKWDKEGGDMISLIENLEELLNFYMSKQIYEMDFLNKFFKKSTFNLPESVSLEIKKHFIQNNLQGSRSSSILHSDSSSQNSNKKKTDDYEKSEKEQDKFALASMGQRSMSITSTTQDLRSSSFQYPLNMKYTPPLAFKYQLTFILTICLTVFMYLSYWYLMLEIYQTLLKIFSEGHYTMDILESMSMVREDAGDLILMGKGFFGKMEKKRRTVYLEMIQSNMWMNLDRIDRGLGRRGQNSRDFDISYRFLAGKMDQQINLTIGNNEKIFQVSLEPITALSVMNMFVFNIYEMMTKQDLNFEKLGPMAENLVYIYDSIIDYGKKEYYLEDYDDSFISRRKSLIMYLYGGSFLIFFILAIFRIVYHLEIYNCKSLIFELTSKLTDKDIYEIAKNNIMSSFGYLEEVISVRIERFEALKNFVEKKTEIFSITRVKAVNSQRRTKNFKGLKKPFCGIIMYHILTFITFTCFSFVFLAQMNVFDNFFNNVYEIHYYFFSKSRFYFDTFSYTKLSLSSKFSEFQNSVLIPSDTSIQKIIRKIRNFENKISKKAQKLNKKYVKEKFKQLSYTDICKKKSLNENLPFDFIKTCPYILNGRLKAGLYVTEIELLNKFQILINNYNVASQDNVMDMLANSEILEMKRTLQILYVLLRDLREEVTDEIYQDYYDYIEFNLGLVMGYSIVISMLILLDVTFVYEKEKKVLIKTRKVIMFFPPYVISSNAYTQTLQNNILRRNL